MEVTLVEAGVLYKVLRLLVQRMTREQIKMKIIILHLNIANTQRVRVHKTIPKLGLQDLTDMEDKLLISIIIILKTVVRVTTVSFKPKCQLQRILNH